MASAFERWVAARRRLDALRQRTASARHRERQLRAALLLSERRITRRQRDVLTLLLQDLSNKDIAAALHISVRTAKFHVSAILRIFEVAGRAELLAALPGEL